MTQDMVGGLSGFINDGQKMMYVIQGPHGEKGLDLL